MKRMENQQPNPKDTAKQSTIDDHSNSQFEELIVESLKSGGLHSTAYKGHGKTRFLFCIAKELMENPNVRTIAFDGSETWLYSFSKIAVFNVSEHDILSRDRKSTDDLEKYKLANWNLVKLALETHKDLLFRLKTRKPSKRGFFIRTVVNFLDEQQRLEKSKSANHENTKAVALFLEEAQNAFNSRSTSSQENETFLSVFNEARNQKIAFFTASQRLNDFSKTIRTKQLQAIGKLNAEDLTPALRKIEKAHNLDFANMKSRAWYFEGSTVQSPDFKQSGKPYIINRAIKEKWLANLPKPKPQSLTDKIQKWLMPFSAKEIITRVEQQKQQRIENLAIQQQAQEDEEEDEELDDMFLLDPLAEEDL
jgi:hypothetical protein